MNSEMYGSSEGKDKIEFRDIILQHLKRILEISSHQLRNKTQIISLPDRTQKTEDEDTRFSYIQAVESLSYALYPYFDDEMQKSYDEYISILNAFPIEIGNRYLVEEFDEVTSSLEDVDDNSRKIIQINLQVKYAKLLFKELNKLLKRNDYLSGSVYSEIAEVDDEKSG